MATLLIEFKGRYNPKDFEDVQNVIKSLKSVSSQIKVTSNSNGISISLDSDKRQYLNPVLPQIVERLQPIETTLNGRRMTGTRL